MTIDTTKPAHDGLHLVVLCHGLWGNVGHVTFIRDQFEKKFGDRICVYRARSNESKYTYDGVDVCGQRLVLEVKQVIDRLEAGGDVDLPEHQDKKKKKAGSSSTSLSSSLNGVSRKVTQFSFLGYSLGGLIGRFAMGIMYMEGFFDKVKPMYFVTMATPHLGVTQPATNRRSKIFNYVSANMLSRSGEQLQLIDNYEGGRPVLLAMADPHSIFWKALELFQTRALYCNIRNDRSVPFWTASFSEEDPFEDLESLNIKYHSGYESVIEFFGPHPDEDEEEDDEETNGDVAAGSIRSKKSARSPPRKPATPWTRYALYSLIPVLFPFWLVIIGSTISVQNLSSRYRLKNLPDIDQRLQKVLAKVIEMRMTKAKAQSSVEGSKSATQGQVELSDIEIVVSADGKGEATTTTTTTTTTNDNNNTSSTSLASSSSSESTSPKSKNNSQKKAFASGKKLPLSPNQIQISKNLNQLNWTKTIIHIESLNAHASIVQREKRFANEGGKAAVQHAVDLFRIDGEDE